MVRYLGDLPALTRKVPTRTTRPGQHGNGRKQKKTEFFYRLIEKQKLRFHYMVSEKQLLRYVKKARKTLGSTGWILLQYLEIRLDNLIYRAGIAVTLPAARQLVNHGHILVNNVSVSIPSFQCQPTQTIAIKKTAKVGVLVQKDLQQNIQQAPIHMSIDAERLIVTINQGPIRSEIPLNLNELLVVEYYSNRL